MGWDSTDRLSASISIHALVKRATVLDRLKKVMLKYFNPRPREEGDPVTLNGKLDVYDFNPRPREEGDKKPLYIVLQRGNFNPRPREEGDLPNTGLLYF